MFDFEKLDVYQVVKGQSAKVMIFLQKKNSIDPYLADQWKKASLSIFLNLAEGTGRMLEEDKKHFLTISRGSVYECTAIIDLLKSTNQIDEEFFTELYNTYEQMSKMLLGMYRSYSK
ncbi:MAG: four helix bundle protein [Bacteroidetes bacterium]|nr:four helix bundle protein [Bacteroidota bacterium]